MEEIFFLQMREQICSLDAAIQPGRMMSSPAITYQGKVFAFYSRQRKMVFKLGKTFDPSEYEAELSVFDPFSKRAPMRAWFELAYTDHSQWSFFTEMALQKIIKEL